MHLGFASSAAHGRELLPLGLLRRQLRGALCALDARVVVAVCFVRENNNVNVRVSGTGSVGVGGSESVGVSGGYSISVSGRGSVRDSVSIATFLPTRSCNEQGVTSLRGEGRLRCAPTCSMPTTRKIGMNATASCLQTVIYTNYYYMSHRQKMQEGSPYAPTNK